MKSEVAALYQHLALKDRIYFRMKWRRGQVFELCESFLPTEGLIIDVGCGTGILSNLLNLQSPQRDVLGLDLDEKRIAVARQTIGERSGIQFELQKLEDLDDRPATGIAVVDVIHHLQLDLTHQLFQKVYAMLQPGGVFLLKDIDWKPRWKFMMNYCLDTFNSMRKFTLGSDLVFRDPQVIQAELESLGFTVERPELSGNSSCPHAMYVCCK